MLQVRNPVLYFFLLELQIFFNFSPDVIKKHDRFSKILLDKGLKFDPCDGNDSIPLHLDLVLLLVEFDSILQK